MDNKSILPILADFLAALGFVAMVITYLEEKNRVVVAFLLVSMFVVGCYAIWRLGHLIGFLPSKAKRLIQTNVWTWSVIAVLWACWVVSFGIRVWPTGVSVNPEFTDAYEDLRVSLGKPTDNSHPVVLGRTLVARFRNGTFIWANSALDYVLWDGGDRRWEATGETTPPPGANWNKPEWLEDHFHLEQGGPPRGDLAYVWDKNPSHWGKLGWALWECTGTSDVIYQDFEQGRIVGVTRGSLNTDTGMIYVLYNNHTWESIHTDSSRVLPIPARRLLIVHHSLKCLSSQFIGKSNSATVQRGSRLWLAYAVNNCRFALTHISDTTGKPGVNQFCYRWENQMGFSFAGDKPGFQKDGPDGYNSHT